MAPIFNFPLPIFRTSSSNQSTPGSQPSQGSSPGTAFATSPSQPISKAEELLGGPPVHEVSERSKKSRKDKKVLRKPSFISVTLTDAGDEYVSYEELKRPFGSDRPGLKRLGSSPLLGRPLDSAPTAQDYFTYPNQASSLSLGPRSVGSSHMKSKSPLSVSQQTSASSSHDIGFRKSSHRVPTIDKDLTDEIVGSSIFQSSLNRNYSGPDHSQRSPYSRARRRPSITDPPTLYPNAPRQFSAVSPPPALIDTSLPKSMPLGESFSKSPSRPRWWQRTRTEPALVSESASQGPLFALNDTRDASSSTKVHIRKPATGVRNWFDGLDEDDVQLGEIDENGDTQEESRYDIAPAPQIKTGNKIVPIHPDVGRRQVTSRKSSFSSKSGPSDRKLSFNLEPIQLGPPNFLGSEPPARTTSRFASPEGRSLNSLGSNKSLGAGLDLQIHSVLNLSSSDDEEEIERPSRELSQRHHPQASMERIEHDEKPLFSDARQIVSIKPCVIMNQGTRHRSPRRSKTPERVPPVPQLPARPPLGQRQSSLRWRQAMEDRGSSTTEGGGDSTVESGSNGETPLSTPIPSRTTSFAHRKKPSIRGSKLMKVTTEEEKLLEAMRAKRASIRANNFQEGFNKAIALQNDPNKADSVRPTTAGAVDGGRDPFRRSLSLCDPSRSTGNSNRSSKKSSFDSTSRPPILTSARYASHTPKPSLALPGNQKSSSTDDLLLEEEVIGIDLNQSIFPFPPMAPPPRTQLPEPPVELQIQPQADMTPSKQSPSLSFDASDLAAPSTPSTGIMPLTPPPSSIPMLPPDLVQGQALGRTLSGSSRKGSGKSGHDRKRTVSSVVILDGCEMEAQVADEERDIVGWAFNSY